MLEQVIAEITDFQPITYVHVYYAHYNIKAYTIIFCLELPGTCVLLQFKNGLTTTGKAMKFCGFSSVCVWGGGGGIANNVLFYGSNTSLPCVELTILVPLP